jgi:mono/diheme cytochrome c family protein
MRNCYLHRLGLPLIPLLSAVILVIHVVTPLLAAPATPTPVAPPVPTLVNKRAEAGKQVYLKNYCGICHTLAAAGTRGTFGPPHDRVATIAKQRIADSSYRGEAKTVVQYLRESIVNPAAYASPGYTYTSHPMPSYAHLPKQDVDSLIYFLLQQK